MSAPLSLSELLKQANQMLAAQNTQPPAANEKSAGPISEYLSMMNPLNSMGGGALGGVAALAMPTRSLARQAEYDSTDNAGRALANVLIPGYGAYNAFKRQGAAIRSPEMKKIRAARAADKLRRELATAAAAETEEEQSKAAGWASEYLGMLNPINAAVAPFGALAAGLTRTRTMDEQADADEEMLSNIFIPGRNVYNMFKRVGAATRSPEMLSLRNQARQKKRRKLEEVAGQKSKSEEKEATAREFGEKVALNLNMNMDPRLMGGLGGAALGAGLGGLLGAFNPGEEETVDDNGRVVRRRKSRLGSALTSLAGGALAGGLGGAALGHFRGDDVRNFGNMLRQRLGLRNDTTNQASPTMAPRIAPMPSAVTNRTLPADFDPANTQGFTSPTMAASIAPIAN